MAKCQFTTKYWDYESPSIRQLVNYLLQKEQFIEKLFYNMELYAVGKSSLFIKENYYNEDKSKDKFLQSDAAEISLIDDKIYCSVDKSDDCRHIHFALCLPEIHVLQNALPSVQGVATGKRKRTD